MSEGRKPLVVAMCASVSFYQQIMEVKAKLEAKGLVGLAPDLAEVMAKRNDYAIESYYDEPGGDEFIDKKSGAIRSHFDKIAKADAVLVINLEKHGNRAYIGPNVLMEVGLGFYLDKPIFVWRRIAEDDRFREEILAMKPVWVDEKVEKVVEVLS